MEVPLKRAMARAVGGIVAPDRRRKTSDCLARGTRKTSLLAESVDELRHLTQAPEIKQMISASGRKRDSGIDIRIGRIEGDARMAVIGQLHDDVGLLAAPDADNGQSLSVERMVRMRDRHVSRRGLGRRGSALGMCPRSRTA